uniref:Beta/gamma crystallin 'Greek key' domain-containing protein n=1 Tax=Cyanoderma ruficeps TaxID=181631 RepID=A0A8C3QFA9_9PASS
MSLRAPHPPVPSALHSRRIRRACRRSTRDLARYREGGGAGPGGRGKGPCGSTFPSVSPLPRSSSTPMPASRGRNGTSGTTSPTPRPGSSHTPSPSESSEAGRDSGGARTPREGLALSPRRGCRSPAFRSDRPAGANYRGRSIAAVAARPRPRRAPRAPAGPRLTRDFPPLCPHPARRWVMYEKPRFRGRKCVLAEGDVEIDNPWTARPFRIGSFKRVVRDYRTPEISLFAEENGEGARLRFSGSAEDTRSRGQALAAASIIVHSGLWLLYSKPFFDDDPYVLEPGGYPNLKAWGAKDPSICSMHPIRAGIPGWEGDGHPWEGLWNGCGSPGREGVVVSPCPSAWKPSGVLTACVCLCHSWVGYEKEGFRGHQYLLEEGEYWDWRQWGGYSKELVSLRLIRTDFSDPALVLFEAMDFEEGPSVELSEALPDTQLAGYGTVTQSIHVLSGVWVAYEGPNYSGEQYILEKGVYRNCEDWGATDCHIASAQPILQVREHNLHFVSKILLFSEPDFLGDQVSFEEDQEALPEAFIPRSCRVRGGSWILFDGQDFAGEQHVLSEGEYPTLSAMGCLCSTAIRSLKKVPLFFSEPSIFLHGLECFEGKEIELNSEVRSLQAEGFNNHVLSVRVKGGIWVLCEHGDFRGRQWLLDCTEITNWLTYSGLQHVGSLYPIRQRRIYFRIRSRKLELFLSVPDDVEEMKAGRVVVSSLSEQSSSVWYYEDGLIKNQVAPTMSLQVIGPAGKGAKAVLWSETRMPRQTWSVDSRGRIRSQMFEDMILDVKGSRSYDQDHAIVWDMADERPTQTWDIQVL